MLVGGRGPYVPPVSDGDHNGGRSQLVLNFPQTGRVFPYMNALKGSSRWDCFDNSGTPNADILDNNGYPLSISNGGVKTVFSIPSAAERPGNWRLRWTGTGRVNISGATTSTGTDGDYTFLPGTAQPTLSITATTNITHVEVFHADDEALIDAGEIWNTKFLDLLREGNWGVIRFLDWNIGNENNITKFRQWKTMDYVTWAGDHIRKASYAGTTTNSGDNYSVAAPTDWEGLIDKALVCCEFNATASSHLGCTLNVAGTGAKEIRAQSGAVLSGSDRAPTINKTATLIYDAVQDVWLKWGGDSYRLDYWIADGVPLAAELDLCVKVGAHPWFCMPYLCAEPQTDFIEGLSDYLIANAPSWMVPRYEVVPNETWNPGAGFTATGYAPLRAEAFWGAAVSDPTEAMHNWVGMVGSIQGEFLSTQYGADRTKYRALCGVQTHGGLTQANPRMTAALWVSENGGDPAHDWITHVCLANYYRDTYTAGERTAAGDAYVVADSAGKLALATALVNSTLVDLGGSQYQFAVPRLTGTLVPNWVAWAQAFNAGINITFYEGGWSPDYSSASGPVTNADMLYAGSRMVAGLEDIASDSYEALVALTDVDFPSHYYMGGAGVWALWDPNTYHVPSPQYYAIITFNGEVRSYDAATEAIAAAFTTPPTAARKALIDAAVVSLKVAGVWAKLDALYAFAAADSQAAKINWKAPGTFNATEVNAPTFTADRGFTGASTKYLDSGFNPSTATTPNYVQNSASLFVWSLTAAQDAGNAAGNDGATSRMLLRNASNNFLGRVQNSGGVDITVSATDGSGLFVASRTGAAQVDTYRNGASVGTSTNASAAIVSQPLYFLKIASSYWLGQMAAGGLGSGLTAADNTALYNALRTYLTGVGVP